MNGWKGKYFKPIEPNRNRGGFRKVKSGEGASMVRGVLQNTVSDSLMKVVKWGLLLAAFSVPVCVCLSAILDIPDLGGYAFVMTVLSHVILMIGEVLTRREISTRFVAMAAVWGTWLTLLGFAIVS